MRLGKQEMLAPLDLGTRMVGLLFANVTANIELVGMLPLADCVEKCQLLGGSIWPRPWSQVKMLQHNAAHAAPMHQPASTSVG